MLEQSSKERYIQGEGNGRRGEGEGGREGGREGERERGRERELERETTYTCFSFSVTTYQNDLYTLMNTRVDHFIEMTVVSVCVSVCLCSCW